MMFVSDACTPNITNDFSGASRSVTDNSRVTLQIVVSLSWQL